MKRKKVLAWVLLFLWMLIIFFFSSQSGVESGRLSNGILDKLLKFSPFSFDVSAMRFVIRKLAHFTEYFLLAILSINVSRQYGGVTSKHVIIILLFCLLYASSDEIHQLFMLNRGPALIDVLLDYCGSLFAITGYVFFKNNTDK